MASVTALTGAFGRGSFRPMSEGPDLVAPVRGRTRVAVLGLTVTAVTTLVTLVLVEVGFRLIAPQPLSPTVISASCVVRHPAGRVMALGRTDWHQTVRFNDLGLRDVVHAREPTTGKPRVTVLGDSF